MVDSWVYCSRMKRKLISSVVLAATICIVPLTSVTAGAQAAPLQVSTASSDGTAQGCGPGAHVVPAATVEAAVAKSHPAEASSTRLIAKAKSRHATWLTSVTCSPTTESSPGGAITSSVSSGNWSGYVVSATSPNYVQGEWYAPSIGPSPLTNTYSSTWVGLGGVSGSPLFQAGIESDLLSSGRQSFFWYEILPTNPTEVKVTSITPHDGDDVGVAVSYQGFQTYFTICDFNDSPSCANLVIPDAHVPGNTAEAIVERPTVNGSLPALANFNVVNFLSASYNTSSNSGGAYSLSPRGTLYYMTATNSSTILAYPTAPNSGGGGFSDAWLNAGP